VKPWSGGCELFDDGAASLQANPECKTRAAPRRGVSKSIGRDPRGEVQNHDYPLKHEDHGRKVRSPENDEGTAFRVSGGPSRPLGDVEPQ